MTIKHTSLFAVILSSLFLLAGTVHAQQGQPGQGGMQQQPAQQPPADVSDQELEKFVQAYAEVSEIQKSFSSDMQEAEDSQEASRIQGEAEQKAVEAIRDAGLEPEEYNQISRAVQSDPELREEVNERLDSEG